jgi:hypothetical protein
MFQEEVLESENKISYKIKVLWCKKMNKKFMGPVGVGILSSIPT